jgi:hypothetical protein
VSARRWLIAGAFAVLTGAMSAAVAGPSATLAQKARDADLIAATAEQNGHVRIIVEFAPPLRAGEIRPDRALLARVKAQIQAMQDAIIATHFGNAAQPRPGSGFPRALKRLEVSPMFAINASLAEVEALAADPRVVRIHHDRLARPDLSQSVPLVGMTGPGGAYVLGATGFGTAVAILDSGVQSSHPFITAEKVVAEACFSNSAGTGVPLCPSGQTSQTGTGAASSATANCINGSTNLCSHGTHVAGIAAGKNSTPGNPAGSPDSGVARDAVIVAVQVFTRFDLPSDCRPQPAPCLFSFSSDQLSALEWIFQNALTPTPAVTLAAVNLSLGDRGQNTSPCDDNPLKGIIDSLRGAGVATAISAGNGGSTNSVSAPGCISTAVTVGSSTKTDALSNFSNMASMVDLLAPGGTGAGGCQLGANNPDILGPIPTNQYDCVAGTSMASAHVAGAFAAVKSAAPSASVDQIEAALKNTGTLIGDNRPGGTQTKPRIRVDLALESLIGSGVATSIVSAVAPNARTTTVNNVVTAFATIINFGPNAAVACSIALPASVPAGFLYQTTDPPTNSPVGSPNTPVNIGAGQAQSFYFAVTPTQVMSQEIPLLFGCANSNRAISITGLNTFLLTASSTAIPDMVSIAATLSNDGNMVIPGTTGTGLMVIASINIGAQATVAFTPTDAPFGQSPRNLPLGLGICQTDSFGSCINPMSSGPASTVTVANNQTVFFAIFATGQGIVIPYDPANNRLFFLATQGSAPVGEASAAVKMQ